MNGSARDFIPGRQILEPKLEKSGIEKMRAESCGSPTGTRIA